MLNTFSSMLFADEDELRFFRDAVEKMLRQGEADEALRRVLVVIDRLDTPTHPLVREIAKVERSTVRIKGWSGFAATTQAPTRSGDPITAIEVDISWPGHISRKPDADGRLEPLLETVLYADGPYTFSGVGRAELLRSYYHGKGGFTWVGAFEDGGNHVTIEGLNGVYGAVYALYAAGAHYALRTKGYDDLSPDEHDLYDLGSIYVAVRLYIAVRDAVLNEGLPKPLTVLLGSNEEYPFFDAPVITADEYAAAWAGREPPHFATPEDEYEAYRRARAERKRRKREDVIDPEVDDIACALVQVIAKRMGKTPRRDYGPPRTEAARNAANALNWLLKRF